jgi:hypothetical protein
MPSAGGFTPHLGATSFSWRRNDRIDRLGRAAHAAGSPVRVIMDQPRETAMNRRNILDVAAITTLAFALPFSNVMGQQGSLKGQLVGTWKLVSSTTKLPDGSAAWGTNPKGLLIFTENGYFSSQIDRSDLPKFTSENRAQGTPEENKAVVQGSSSSFGTYTVDETKKIYTLKFEGSSFPNRLGTEQTRAFTIAGDELKIDNPATTVGGSSELIYKRAK